MADPIMKPDPPTPDAPTGLGALAKPVDASAPEKPKSPLAKLRDEVHELRKLVHSIAGMSAPAQPSDDDSAPA